MNGRRLLATVLLSVLLLLPPLALLGVLGRNGEIAFHNPWSGASYALIARPCSPTAPASLVLHRRPSYYVIAQGRELLSLPLSPRCF